MSDPSDPSDVGDDFDRLLEEDPRAALEEALAWIIDEPDSADAHYAAGLSYEALDREADKVREFLQVMRLDALEAASPIPSYERIICDEVESVLSGLPPDVGERLGPVAVMVEPRPNRALVEEGVDPRLLGLFEGATAEELAGNAAPLTTTRILIFSHNLASAFEDEVSLRDEVAVTVLHEVGHFFGLDEDDMERLGLD